MSRASAPHAQRDFYDVFTPERPRFADTDMIGHVNNVGHTAIIETGRIGYIMDRVERAGYEFGRIMFARLEIDFLADLYWPSEVQVGARCVRIGTSSFTVATGTFAGEQCAATSMNVMVFLGEDGRPTPLPDGLREVLAADLPAETDGTASAG